MKIRLAERWRGNTNRPHTDTSQKGYTAMKKTIAIACAALFTLSLAGCGTSASSAGSTASESTASSAATTAESSASSAEGYRIAIVQQMDHASLDQIRAAIEAELDAKAAEQGVAIEYELFNGQNDATTLNQIGTQVITDGYDAIIPIATLAAQCMANAAADTETPVIYAAISDPAAADLTDISYVTGTSDYLDTEFIMEMMFAANPDIETVGLLYSNSEPNSEAAIEAAKAYLDEKGVAYVEATGNTNDEVLSAAVNLADQADAVFTPTDNVIMAAAGAVATTFTEAGIPYYTGADSFVTAGALATCGVNYDELGAATADLALEVLDTGTVPEYQIVPGGIITVNTGTAAALGVDPSVYTALGGELVEVTTAE